MTLSACRARLRCTAGYTAFLLLTEGNGLLVYTAPLVAVLLWHVHRRAGRTR